MLGHGKIEGTQIDEAFSVEFKDRNLQVNSVGIGMINEFRLLHSHTYDNYEAEAKSVTREVLPPNDANFAFDPWHLDGSLHRIRPSTNSKEYVGVRSTYHNVDSVRALDIEEYKTVKMGIRRTLAMFDSNESNQLPTAIELGPTYWICSSRFVPACVQKMIPVVQNLRQKKHRISVDKMHALSQFLQSVNETVEFKEKHLQVHYLNIGGLEGLCFSVNPYMCNGNDNIWWVGPRPPKDNVYNISIAAMAKMSQGRQKRKEKSLISLVGTQIKTYSRPKKNGENAVEDLDGYIGNRRFVFD